MPSGFGSFFRQHKLSLGVGLLLLFVLPIAVFLAQNQIIIPRAGSDLPQSRLFLESPSKNVNATAPLKIDLILDTSKDPEFVATGVDAIITVQASDRDKALVSELLQNLKIEKGQAFETITKQEVDAQNQKIIVSASNQSVKDNAGNPTGFTGRGTVLTLKSTLNTPSGGPTPPQDALPRERPTPLTFRLSYSASDSTNDTNIVAFERGKPVSSQSPRERFLSPPQDLTLALGGPASSPSPSGSPVICWNVVINNGQSWPDGCRGRYQPGQACTEALVGLTEEEKVQYKSWLAQGSPPISGCSPSESPTPTAPSSCGNKLCEIGEGYNQGGCGPNADPGCLGYPVREGTCPQDCAAGNKCLNGSMCSSGSACPTVCTQPIDQSVPPQCQPGVCPGVSKSPTPTPTPKPQVRVQIQLTFEDRTITTTNKKGKVKSSQYNGVASGTLYGVPANQVLGVSIAQGFSDVSGPIIITDPPEAFPPPRPSSSPISVTGAQTIAHFVTNSEGSATITVPEQFYGKSYWLYVRTPSHLRRISTDGPYTFPAPVTCSPLQGALCPQPVIRPIQFNLLVPGDIYIAPGATEQDNLINTFDATELLRHLNQRAKPVGQTNFAPAVSNSGISQDEQQKLLSLLLPHPADLNGDGIVNTRDLKIILKNMGRTGDEFNQSIPPVTPRPLPISTSIPSSSIKSNTTTPTP